MSEVTQEPGTSLKTSGGVYPIEVKIEVAQKYVLLGNMRLVSEVTGISYDTLMEWKKTKWWVELLQELKAAKKATSTRKLSTLLDNSLDVIADKLENGEVVFNSKTGEFTRVSLPAREVIRLTEFLLKHQRETEKLEQQIVQQDHTVDSTLKVLAKEFAKWAKKPAVQEVVDVEANEIKE